MGEKCEHFKLPTLIFCIFSCNLSRISKGNHLSKNVGVTDFPSELNPSKVNATATIPSGEQTSPIARALVHDVGCRCDMNCMHSKSAHKRANVVNRVHCVCLSQVHLIVFFLVVSL